MALNSEPDLLTLAVLRVSSVVSLKAQPGDVLFHPGEACRGFLVLRSGVIRVQITAANGREIVLYRVRPGAICLQTFTCLAQDKLYGAEGIAEQDVDALLISPAIFQRLMAEDRGFRAAVLSSVADRFSDFEQVVSALAFAGLESRLAGALIRMSEGQVQLDVTHAQLATEIGSAREAVSRQLAVFARSGIVELSRGRIDILNRPALVAMTRDPV